VPAAGKQKKKRKGAQNKSQPGTKHWMLANAVPKVFLAFCRVIHAHCLRVPSSV